MTRKDITATQRQQMQELTTIVARVAQSDRRYFERFPKRKHRIRVASAAEIAQFEIIANFDMTPPIGCQHFMAVRKLSPDVRLRRPVTWMEGAETDVDEATAEMVFESVATDMDRLIEERLSEALEARA